MQQSSFSPRIDEDLLGKFDEKILSRTPHIVGGENDGVVTNPTPLVDLTAALSECARSEYGIRIDPRRVRVFGKLDSNLRRLRQGPTRSRDNQRSNNHR